MKKKRTFGYNIKELIYNASPNQINIDYIIHVLKTKDNVIVNDDNDYPLRWAVYHNYGNLVKELLKYSEVNPLCDGYFCLSRSITNNNINILLMLINDHRTLKDIDSISKYVIDKCIEDHKPEILEYILSLNIINVKDSFGTVFCRYDFTRNKCLNVLLNDKRFDPSYTDNKFLKRCINNKNYDVIKLLIKNNNVMSKIEPELINILGELKLLPIYKSKKNDRTI